MNNHKPFKTTIGGQALIEGVMMVGPSKTSIAVRKPDGEIELKVTNNKNLEDKYPFLNLPILRGAYKLIQAMVRGVNALTYSASFYEEEESSGNSFLQRKFPKYGESIETALTILVSIVIAVLFFIILPSALAGLVKDKVNSTVLLNVIEGLVRLLFFFVYLMGISKIDDIARVFEYHGAEHKSIHCYENGDDLTVENVLKYSRMHPRCGTSFLFMVLIVSIIVLSFFGWPNPIQRVLIRLLLFPLIAGISYEINRIVGKSNGKLSAILRYPGIEIQKLATVREPDADQVEVGLAALIAVLPEAGEDDHWN